MRSDFRVRRHSGFREAIPEKPFLRRDYQGITGNQNHSGARSELSSDFWGLIFQENFSWTNSIGAFLGTIA